MSYIEAIWSAITNYASLHQWIFQVFLVVLFTAVLRLVVNSIYNRLLARLRKTKTLWDDVVFEALQQPLMALIWLLGVCFAANIVYVHAPEVTLFKLIDPIQRIGIIVIFAWAMLRLVKTAEEEFSKSKKADKTIVQACAQLMRVVVLITVVLICMQSLGLNISGLLAVGGAGTLVVGLAAKDMMANFFGGIIIYLDRPFKIGDWVRSPDRNIEGTVETIGWRSTCIRTFDKRPLYVPNSVFSTIAIENPSRMFNRRIYTNIGVRYDDANILAALLADIEKMLHTHPEIDTQQTLMVNLVNLSASSLEFMIYCFTKTTEWVKYQAILQDVLLRILQLVEAHGAQCAFPTSTLHIPDPVKLQQFEQEQNH